MTIETSIEASRPTDQEVKSSESSKNSSLQSVEVLISPLIDEYANYSRYCDGRDRRSRHRRQRRSLVF